LTALIPKGPRHHVKALKGPMVLGVDLQDAREEIFVRMVCDGITLGVAYARAGYKGTPQSAHALFHVPRIQERANAILEARRTTGVVTLPQVTDMLQRVFAGAHAAEEYSAAHNAAFSLARLYGHVTDKSTLEVIRRPSRDPDAPSEQALEAWALSLPVVGYNPLPGFDVPDMATLPGPEPSGPEPSGPAVEPSEPPPRGAPAAPLGQGPFQNQEENSSDINWLREGPGPQGQGPGLDGDLSSDFKGLAGQSPGGTGNGAPSGPVTGTPNSGGRAGLLGPEPNSVAQLDKRRRGPGPEQKGAPRKPKKGNPPTRGKNPKKRKLSPRSPKIPSAKDLFG
jgi:hypothetical protein